MPRPRVAINGFGRIGHLVARAMIEARLPVELVAVNDLTDAATLAHMFRYDSVHGRFPGDVRAEDGHLVVDGRRVRVLAEKDPAKLPWRELGVDYVIESTGRFRTRAELAKHLEAGARRVVLTAPGKDADVTLVPGVNQHAYDPEKHTVLSMSSCTTNCIVPVLKVLDDAFGVESAMVTTVHSYTNDQNLLDHAHKDLRRARAAATNIIPTSTGAAEAVAKVLPHLAGKVDGMAVRVPTPNVSLVDATVRVGRNPTREAVENAFVKASKGDLGAVLAVERAELVSSDFNHTRASATVDLPSLMVTGGLVKVLAWYDNEWAYSNRVAELVVAMWEAEPAAVRELAAQH